MAFALSGEAVGTEELVHDGSDRGLGVEDEEQVEALGSIGVTAPSSTLSLNPTVFSAFILAFEALGLSLIILEKSSVCVPLTALETVSRLFLTRDMCWLRPADHRDDEVFKYRVLVWRLSLC